ncbi:MAG: DUF1735 domain-containing protein [Bacteroidota bacterium]|nr:DUF1735 domain-containing protein [Bacteroidota bacterium]
MKLQSKKLFIMSVMLLIIIASGCLKDKAYDNGDIQSGHGSTVKVIAIGTNVSSQANFVSLAFNTSSTDTTINLIPVTLGSTQPAQQDIHVTLVQDTSLITNYNDSNGTNYTVPTMFTLTNPGGVVIIPKGSYVGYLQIKFVPNDFINGAPYAVGYTIKSVAESGYTISGNLQHGIAAIGIKNKYDGNYGLVIKTIGWENYGVSDNLPGTWPVNANGTSIGMVTSGANSVKLLDYVAFGTFIQIAFTTGNAGKTGFGNTAPKFTFDPTSNMLTDVSNDVVPDARNRAFHLNPAITDSRYDPTSQTIYAAYIMTQNGRPDQQIYDTLSYLGVRP